jgi:hypothetical protein
MANILYVDDNPLLGEPPIRRAVSGKHKLTVIDTSETGWRLRLRESSATADIVVSDLRLEHTAQAGDLDPHDGQAMNDAIHALNRKSGRASIYMIYSAAIDDEIAARNLPPSVFARAEALGATWIGSKPVGTNQDPGFPRDLLLFADAVDGVAELTAGADYWLYLAEQLMVPADAEWRDEALVQLRSCAPSLSDRMTQPDRMAVIHWISSFAFRYPAFVIPLEEVALRLRVSADWLGRQWESNSGAWDAFHETAEYRGPLAGLAGGRWWRAAVDLWAWSATEGQPFDLTALRTVFARLGGDEPQMIEILDPVLAYDEHGQVTREVLPVESAVRILPSGWPSAASVPWASISRAKIKPALAAIVAPEDQERLAQ